MKHLTFLGIDGAGKSTLASPLLEQLERENIPYCFLSSPHFEEGPDCPFSDLSKALNDFSLWADLYKSFELKAISLYLQVSLWGPIESFFLQHWSPKIVVSLRHPLIDSLVYGELYQRYIQKEVSLELVEELKKQKFWPKMFHWFFLQTKRMKISSSFEKFPLELKRLFSLSYENLLSELKEHYQTQLPTDIYFLNISSEEAFSRIQGSRESLELHENQKSLQELLSLYEKTLEYFRVNYPEMRQETFKKIPSFMEKTKKNSSENSLFFE